MGHPPGSPQREAAARLEPVPPARAFLRFQAVDAGPLAMTVIYCYRTWVPTLGVLTFALAIRS